MPAATPWHAQSWLNIIGAYSAMDAAAAALHVDGVSVSAAERQQPVLE